MALTAIRFGLASVVILTRIKIVLELYCLESGRRGNAGRITKAAIPELTQKTSVASANGHKCEHWEDVLCMRPEPSIGFKAGNTSG